MSDKFVQIFTPKQKKDMMKFDRQKTRMTKDKDVGKVNEEVDQIVTKTKMGKLICHELVKCSLDILKEMWENANGTKR